MEQELVKVYKLIHEHGGSYIAEDPKDLCYEFAEDQPEKDGKTSWTIEVFWMTREAIDALPDFDGF